MWTLCVWLGRIGEYHLHSSKLRFNTDLRPSAVGPYWTTISQNSDGIPQYVLARRTVFHQFHTVSVFFHNFSSTSPIFKIFTFLEMALKFICSSHSVLKVYHEKWSSYSCLKILQSLGFQLNRYDADLFHISYFSQLLLNLVLISYTSFKKIMQ